MTNLFKRFFTHKSKFLLIIISLLGLAFSYSCSCRNDSTGPGNDGNGGNGGGSGNNNSIRTFSPTVDDIFNETNSVAIASKDGNTKTQIKIKFEGGGHDIKTAKPTKVVDTNGTDLTDKVKYNLSDFNLSFTKANLQSILQSMDSSTAPATNILTLTFELTTDATNVSNTTNTIENVKVEIVKTQEFDDKSEILKGIISGIGYSTIDKWNSFDFGESGKADIDIIELDNSDNSEDGAGQTGPSASQYVDDIINNSKKSIKRNSNYKKYFDNVVNEPLNVTGSSTVLTIKLTFTPKNIYDMALTNYTIKLDTLTSGNWQQ